ncbi:MAG: YaaL family protein [Clostridia bacterium]
MGKVISIEMKPTENSNYIQELLSNLIASRKPPIHIDPESREKQELIDYLFQAKKELDIANSNFEFAKDNELIDYFIYEIKAAETRYQYLLKKAKERNISVASFENIHISNRRDKAY